MQLSMKQLIALAVSSSVLALSCAAAPVLSLATANLVQLHGNQAFSHPTLSTQAVDVKAQGAGAGVAKTSAGTIDKEQQLQARVIGESSLGATIEQALGKNFDAAGDALDRQASGSIGRVATHVGIADHLRLDMQQRQTNPSFYELLYMPEEHFKQYLNTANMRQTTSSLQSKVPDLAQVSLRRAALAKEKEGYERIDPLKTGYGDDPEWLSMKQYDTLSLPARQNYHDIMSARRRAHSLRRSRVEFDNFASSPEPVTSATPISRAASPIAEHRSPTLSFGSIDLTALHDAEQELGLFDDASSVPAAAAHSIRPPRSIQPSRARERPRKQAIEQPKRSKRFIGRPRKYVSPDSPAAAAEEARLKYVRMRGTMRRLARKHSKTDPAVVDLAKQVSEAQKAMRAFPENKEFLNTRRRVQKKARLARQQQELDGATQTTAQQLSKANGTHA